MAADVTGVRVDKVHESRWTVSTVYVQNGNGISGTESLSDCRCRVQKQQTAYLGRHWKIVHDVTTNWLRACVEELVKRRLGDWLQQGGTGESDDID